MKKLTLLFALALLFASVICGCDKKSSVGPGDNPVVTSLTVFKNTDFSGGSAATPNGIPNRRVKIGSVTIWADSIKADTLSTFNAVDFDAANSLGANFRDLEMMHGEEKIGETISDLSGVYSFTSSAPIILPEEGSITFDYYAVIKSNATNVNTDLHGIKFYSLKMLEGGEEVEHIAPTELQPIYVAGSGKLYVSVSPSTPIAQQLVMGTTNQEVLRLRLETDFEDVVISSSVISDVMSGIGTPEALAVTLCNTCLYDSATGMKIAGPVNFQTVSGQSFANATVGCNLTVPIGGLTIKFYPNVTSYSSGAVSGSSHRLGILMGEGSFTATGVVSGRALSYDSGSIVFHSKGGGNNADQLGNAVTVLRTKFSSFTWAPDSPSGTQISGTNQIIAKIGTANTANSGNFSLNMRLINPVINSNIVAEAPRTLRIYKSTLADSNCVATFTWPAGSLISTLTLTDGDFTDVEALSGKSKIFWFTLDTTDANQGGFITVGIDENSVVWDDGVSVTSEIPASGRGSRTLTY